MKKCNSIRNRILSVAFIAVMAIGMAFSFYAGISSNGGIDVSLSDNEALARAEYMCIRYTYSFATGKCVYYSDDYGLCFGVEEGERADCNEHIIVSD